MGSPRRAGTNHRPGTNGSSPQGLFGLSEDVVGADLDAVLAREREVGERVDLGVFEHPRGRRRERLELRDGAVVERAHQRGVRLLEDG